MKKTRVLCLMILLVSMSLVACSSKEEGKIKKEVASAEDYLLVVDTLGREVKIGKNSQRFVNIGPGSLRLYSYVGPMDKLVGVEERDKKATAGVGYSSVNAKLLESLPIIGQGGPRGSINIEEILNARPDVIFDTYSTDVESANQLEKKSGIPVVVLNYGKIGVFDEKVNESLLLIGKVTGFEGRGEEVVKILKDYREDLEGRTKDIKEEDRKTAYIGGLGNKGAHGIESTRGKYILFDVVNAINVVDETNSVGSVMIDKEELLKWDPEYIFIDYGGLELLREDYERTAKLYESLSAFKENKVYSQLPFNIYSTNIETAIANAYYIGSVMYPDLFSDIVPEEKADEIYVNLLGKSFYSEILRDYGGFGSLNISK